MYKVFLSLHIVAIISWMAGLLYLYRLFVYHAEEKEAVVKERFILMERRLLGIITLPASIASLLFGMFMIYLQPSLIHERWLQVKLVFVFILFFLTHFAGKLRKGLEIDQNKLTSRQLRWLNEAPTLLLIIIVFLVILRPF